MTKILLIFTTIFALFAGGCEVNPITGQQELISFGKYLAPSIDEQKQIGQKYAPEMAKQMGGEIPDSQLQAYINQVGQKVAKASGFTQVTFQYKALNDQTVNAFALPGGYIFITKGMLSLLKNEAQLAAILGHETAHVTQEHSAKQMGNQIGMDLILSTISTAAGDKGQAVTQVAQIGSQLTSLKYSRSDETEADSIGLDYMVKAGYSPKGMVESMQILESLGDSGKFEFLSTHPSPANRVKTIQSWINQRYPQASAKDMGATAYQKNVLPKLK